MQRPAAPVDLRAEHMPAGVPALGLGTARPRLSWRVPQAPPGYLQAAYEVEVVGRNGREAMTVASPDQVLVPWPVAPLPSARQVALRVRVRAQDAAADSTDGWSDWSDTAIIESGLLSPSDWQTRFISPAGAAPPGHGPAPVLVGRVELSDDIAAARLRVTAHGVFIAHLNGHRVGDEELAPGWTSYHHRLRYRTHDVTDLVVSGHNLFEVVLGNGWYRGRIGWAGERAFYGDRLALLLQLEVTTSDGAVHVRGGDETWVWRESGVTADDLYDGEERDMRRPLLGDPRATPRPVEMLDPDTAPLTRLVAPQGPPVRVVQVVPALSVTTSPAGRTLVDFGQNVVGRVRLRARGTTTGQQVVLRHAEVLEDGELGTRPLRSAKATDTFRCAGGDAETLEPIFTVHGFRYAEVNGITGLRAEDLEAVVLSSDLVRTGWFASSHETLNHFHDNVMRSLRGNFLDVPTDCPQRDERLGWTGDIQVFAPTACFLVDCAGFLSSWLADLAVDQTEDGVVPFVVPDVLHRWHRAAAAWGDAACVVPIVVYDRFGDVDILRRQLPSMRAWVDRLVVLAGDDGLWSGGYQFGDWLDPTAPPDDPYGAAADPDVVATAHLVRSAEMTARAAQLSGEDDNAEYYRHVAATSRRAFAHAYVTPAGRVISESATTYALALQWDLLPTPAARTTAGNRLADLVRAAGFRISTGFVGTPLVADALADAGHADVAYRLLLQTECPSWLYPATMGATTVWERWDSMLPDGSINSGEMTSFNHYALGAVADWLHRRVAGLAPAAPGYRVFDVRPLVTTALDHAEARHTTPYGDAGVRWERRAGRFRLTVDVPVGATAHVVVPGRRGVEIVGHGHHAWEVPDHQTWSRRAAPRSVRDVLDDEELWSAVVAAAVDIGAVTGQADAAKRLSPVMDRPWHEIAQTLDAEAALLGETALTHRLDMILGGDAPPSPAAAPEPRSDHGPGPPVSFQHE